MVRRVAIFCGLVGLALYASAGLKAEEPKSRGHVESAKPNSAGTAAASSGETKYDSGSSSASDSGSSEESEA